MKKGDETVTGTISEVACFYWLCATSVWQAAKDMGEETDRDRNKSPKPQNIRGKGRIQSPVLLGYRCRYCMYAVSSRYNSTDILPEPARKETWQ